MKPSMRLANSTTYWMASVIFSAHSCHMTSRGCRGRSRTRWGLYIKQGLLREDSDGWRSAHLALVALHLVLQEALPAHVLQLLLQVLTRLQVRLGDDLTQVIWNTEGEKDQTFWRKESIFLRLKTVLLWSIVQWHERPLLAWFYYLDLKTTWN